MASEIIVPGFERNDERGLFREILNSGDWQAMNWARMKPGSTLGDHYHKKTTLFLYLVTGSAGIKTVHIVNGQREDFELKAGQGVLFKPLESHVIRFLEESEVIMLKSLKFDPADPDIYHHPV